MVVKSTVTKIINKTNFNFILYSYYPVNAAFTCNYRPSNLILPGRMGWWESELSYGPDYYRVNASYVIDVNNYDPEQDDIDTYFSVIYEETVEPPLHCYLGGYNAGKFYYVLSDPPKYKLTIFQK